MSRPIVKSLASAVILVGACGSSNQERGRNVASVSEGDLCVYIANPATKPLQILNLTAERGGRSCFSDGEKKVIIPANNGRCSDIGDDLTLSSGISIAQADYEFSTCSALFRPSQQKRSTIYYTIESRNLHDEDKGFFLFGADIQTLVTNDALPVSHFGRYGRLLCMETDDVDKVLAHISEADAFVPENVSRHIKEEMSCAQISQDIQGLNWPEFRPDPQP